MFGKNNIMDIASHDFNTALNVATHEILPSMSNRTLCLLVSPGGTRQGANAGVYVFNDCDISGTAIQTLQLPPSTCPSTDPACVVARLELLGRHLLAMFVMGTNRDCALLCTTAQTILAF